MQKKTKKKLLVGLVIILFALALVPFPIYYKDGGTTEYAAILWGVTKYHSLTRNPYDPDDRKAWYEIGTSVRILFFTVYNDFPKEVVKD